jgi:hypothetical protein
MSIIVQEFERAGTMHGMQVIRESGLIPDDEVMDTYETGRVELIALPRTAGIVVKVLDGGDEPVLFTISNDAVVGTVGNLLQLGRTTKRRAFPEQPFGTYSNKEILSYDRLWVQLEV